MCRPPTCTPRSLEDWSFSLTFASACARSSLARSAARGDGGQRRRSRHCREGSGALEAEHVRAEAGCERSVAGDEREADERRRRGCLERGEGGRCRVEERLERVVVVGLRSLGEVGSERNRGAVLGVGREEHVGRPLVGRRREHGATARLVRREDGAARDDRVDDPADVRGHGRDGEAVGERRANGSGARGVEAAVEPHDVVGGEGERARRVNEREQRRRAG
eukprot:scaffold9499_cov55-Phaeocystis_antarctica.AAC.3